MPLPLERRTFFNEHFDRHGYVDNIDYDGTNLPTYWDVTGSTYTPASRYLVVDGPVELTYNQQFIHNNFAVFLLLQSIDNVVCEIKTRYDPALYTSTEFDFSADSVTISQVGGSPPATVTDSFNFNNGTFYVLSAWNHNNNVYAWINGYNILTSTATSSAKTFSLNITSGSARLLQLKAIELINPIDPTREDETSNTLVQYRKFLQDELAIVSEQNWEAYRKAHNRYRHNRNIGAKDSAWESMGYPVPKPSTDAFFND